VALEKTLHAWGYLPGRYIEAHTQPDPGVKRCPTTVA
jgi:hypothetical protein